MTPVAAVVGIRRQSTGGAPRRRVRPGLSVACVPCSSTEIVVGLFSLHRSWHEPHDGEAWIRQSCEAPRPSQGTGQDALRVASVDTADPAKTTQPHCIGLSTLEILSDELPRNLPGHKMCKHHP